MIDYDKIRRAFEDVFPTLPGTLTVTLGDGSTTQDVAVIAANATPEGFDAEIPFVRLNFLYNASAADYSIGILAGTFIIDIFIEASKGMGVAYSIANHLEGLLSRKVLGKETGFNGVCTDTSFIRTLGVDGENKSIYRLEYNLPFKHFFSL